MHKESSENILLEANQEEFQTEFQKVNKRLWLWITLLGSIIILGLIIVGFINLEVLVSLIMLSLPFLIIIILAILFFSALIGRVSFREWNYEDRVYRITLIFFLVTEIATIILAINTAFILYSRYGHDF